MDVGYRASSAKMGYRIKKARVAAGFSQERLAAMIRTSRRNVLRWEGGHNLPRPQHIAAIAEATGQSTDFFLNGDDEDEEADLYAALLKSMRAVARLEAERVWSEHDSELHA